MRGKKILSVAVSSALMLSMLPAQAVTAPADQLAGQWYEAAMTTAVERGIIGGDESGNLQPARNITRGEMAVMLDRIMDYQAKADNKFGDLAAGVYYTDAILAASAAGILKGDDLGNVKPGAGITRQETAVMLARVMNIEGIDAPSGNFADQSSIAPWAVKAVNAMKAAGYMGAQEVSFRPADAITRAEVATVLGNIFAGYFNEAKTYSADVNGSAVVNAAGATLKNMKISGDLIVAEGLAEGNLYLDGVTVGGRLLVRGGGVNSVYIRGTSQVGNVIVSRQDGPVRVVVEGGAKVEVVVVDDGSDAVKLEGTLGSVVIEGTAAVEVAGTVGTVTVDAADASLKVSGTVAKVATTENAAGAVIEAAAGGKITAVEAGGAGTQITGSGKVDSVSAKANDVTVATPGTKVEAAPGTSGVTAGGKPVAGGSTGGGSSTGGGGGSYEPPSTAHIANVATLPELTAALANTSKTVINITADITSAGAPVKVERAVTINGGGKSLTFSGLEQLALDVMEDDGLIIYKTAAGTVVNNLIVDAGLSTRTTWAGTYAIHAYDTSVTLKDVKATGGNGGILVNGSEVTLEGRVDVFDNGFGGIEVSKGTDLTKNGELTVSGTIVNSTEAADKPTVWVINGQGSITGDTEFGTKEVAGKIYYYLHVTGTVKDIGNLGELNAALTEESINMIRFTNNITSGNPVEVKRKVTIDGNNKTLTVTGLKDVTGTVDDALILYNEASESVISNLTVNADLGTDKDSWVGTYAIHVYNATDVTLKDVKATGGNGGILVNGSEVTLEGRVDVSDNGFGGIEVAKATELTESGKLTVAGTIVNADETKATPTIWVENNQGTVVGGTFLTAPHATKTQTLYYLMENMASAAKVLEGAKGFKYNPEYKNVGLAEIAENTVNYTASADKFVDESEIKPRPATADLARFLGAMYRFDDGKSVYKITYKNTEYVWDVAGTSKGSNWKDAQKNTLVKAIADDMDDHFNASGNLVENATPSFILNINGEAVTFNISVSSSDTPKG